jgi:hypothetical protein
MRHLQEKMAFLLDPSLYLLGLFALNQLRKKDINTDNENTGQPGRASTHIGLTVFLPVNLTEGSRYLA